jgi:hypothetical protein
MAMIRIRLKDVMGGQDVLFGVSMGKQCLLKLLESASAPETPTLVVLDFQEVASATVSFLREGPLAYRKHLRKGTSSNLYPVFANLSEAVADSLIDFLTASRDAVFACEIGADDTVANPRLLGQLEPMQRLTFEAVLGSEGVTATDLARGNVEGGVQVTAWNNRLVALAQKGLLIETREGRQKTYRTLFAEEAV